MMRLKFYIGNLIGVSLGFINVSVVLKVMITVIDEFIVTILGFVVGVIIGD